VGFQAKLRNFFFKVNSKHEIQIVKFEIRNQENVFIEKKRNFGEDKTEERKRNQRSLSKGEEEEDEMRDTELRN